MANTALLARAQNYRSQMTLHVHTATNPMLFVSAIRSQMTALDPNLPFFDITTLEKIYDGPALSPARVGASLAGGFGLLGLFLAAVGVYGLLNYYVSRRTHEIGVRMALDARRADILTMVLRDAVGLALPESPWAWRALSG